jgi:hypothetical protein
LATKECGVPTDHYESVQDFLKGMDAGEFDNKLWKSFGSSPKNNFRSLEKS